MMKYIGRNSLLRGGTDGPLIAQRRCPRCNDILVRLRARRVCVSIDSPCDYSEPAVTLEPAEERMEPAARKEAESAERARRVLLAVKEAPWSGTPHVARRAGVPVETARSILVARIGDVVQSRRKGEKKYQWALIGVA